MLFDEKKLSVEAMDEMIQCPIASVKSFSLMLSPVYVFMKLNEKLVSVKAPLDFFTEDELERLRRYETFYLPKFALSSVRFQTSARVIKKILQPNEQVFSRAPYELSHEIRKMIGPLWGKEMFVEPFFMCIFAEELCESLPMDQMLEARENAIILHDLGLMLSGAFVFLTLMVRQVSLSYLSKWRHEIYLRTLSGEDWAHPANEEEFLLKDLHHLISNFQSLNEEQFKSLESEWSQRIVARLKLIGQENENSREKALTIYGEEGFVA